MQPIREYTIHLPTSSLPKYGEGQWAALDRGSSLTKLVYVVGADENENPDSQILQCAFFENDKFVEAVDWFHEKAQLQREKGPLRVTGVGGAAFGHWLQEKLNVEVEFLDEFLCHMRGGWYMVQHLTMDKYCVPTPNVDQLVDKLHDCHMTETKEDAKAQLPGIFVILGSGCSVVRVNENGTGTFLTGCTLGGHYLLGMGKALVGTQTYEELCELATAGDRSKCDAEGHFFGALVETASKVAFRREDLARALVSSLAYNVAAMLSLVCRVERIDQVFIAGNLALSQIMRDELTTAVHIFTGETTRLRFLKTGFSGALGGMVTSKKQQEEFFAAAQTATAASS